MFVSGFTFVRNAVKYDYPVVESILSILPLCDEVVVVLGDSQDNTKEVIQAIDSPKIRIIDSIWDQSLRSSGAVLAVETNKAFDAINPLADWAFYIQADELVHEKDYPAIRRAMEENLNDPKVDGLLFDYNHFYGNYSYLGDARRWYPKEVRIIRNNKEIRSYRDAQGFRRGTKKLQVHLAHASIYHYGWVKPPEKQGLKRVYFESLYDASLPQENAVAAYQWDYSNNTRLKAFTGTHPSPMLERVKRLNWHFEYDPSKLPFSLKESFHRIAEKCLGHRIFEFRNYKIIS